MCIFITIAVSILSKLLWLTLCLEYYKCVNIRHASNSLYLTKPGASFGTSRAGSQLVSYVVVSTNTRRVLFEHLFQERFLHFDVSATEVLRQDMLVTDI